MVRGGVNTNGRQHRTLVRRGIPSDKVDGVVVLIFSTDAIPVYNPTGDTVYNADALAYAGVKDNKMALRVVAIQLDGAGWGLEFMKPTAGSIPSSIASEDFEFANLPVTLSDYQGIYNDTAAALSGGVKVTDVYLLVDISDSMYGGGSPPGQHWLHDYWTDFKTWLTDEKELTVHTSAFDFILQLTDLPYSFDLENWLAQVTTAINDWNS